MSGFPPILWFQAGNIFDVASNRSLARRSLTRMVAGARRQREDSQRWILTALRGEAGSVGHI